MDSMETIGKRLNAARKVILSQELKVDDFEKALENILKYKWEGSGPSGCDNHCIEHPCGPCAFEVANLRGYVMKVLRRHKEL